jgi:carbonic anhydrase
MTDGAAGKEPRRACQGGDPWLDELGDKVTDLQQPGATRRGFFAAAGSASMVATGVAAAGLAGSVLAGAAPVLAAPGPNRGPGSTGPGSMEPGEAADGRRPGPREALRILLAGNQRWAHGQAEHPRQSVWWRHRLDREQHPFATVLSCIDSRVPPELVFDCGLGDLFVVRTGAQVLDERAVLGSIEFGPVNFRATRLILVLGHSGCGAVAGAIELFRTGGRAPGHIQSVVDALRPAYHVAVRERGNLLDNMIRAQTKLTVRRLERDPVLRDLIRSTGLMVVGGHYDLHSGVVSIIA